MIKKILLGILVAIILGLVLMVVLSPYKKHDGFGYKLIKNTVVINAPVDSVFRYLGKSANAHYWSVYVDHISPLNADSVPDGMPGSRRRAFCTADEQGQRWDELLTVVEKNKKRQIATYNYIDFAVSADHLATEQIYVPLDSNTTELSFTVFYLDHEPGFWDLLKTHFASYTILDIFEQNMNNIKRIIETGK